MKIFLIVLSVIFMTNSALSIELEEIVNAGIGCTRETGISQDLIVEAQNGDIVDDSKLKQHLKCFYSKLQVLEGENINIVKLMEYLEANLPNKTKAKREEIAQICYKKQESAEETALELAKCITYEKTNMEEEISNAWIYCMIHANVSEKSITKATNGVVVDDPNLKKALKCYYSNLHVMKGEDINSKKLKQYLKIMMSNKNPDEIEEIVQKCNKKKVSAEETAFDLAKCQLKNK